MRRIRTREQWSTFFANGGTVQPDRSYANRVPGSSAGNIGYDGEDGYDEDGYDEDGYDEDGYDGYGGSEDDGWNEESELDEDEGDPEGQDEVHMPCRCSSGNCSNCACVRQGRSCVQNGCHEPRGAMLGGKPNRNCKH